MKNILKLIKSGESQTVEFKRSLSEKDKAIQEIASFANTGGGTLFFGIADDGKIIGVDIGKNTLEGLSNKITTNTDPVIYPTISVESIEGRQIIIVEVKKSSDKLHLAFGRPYKRVGKNTIQMKRDEYERLILEKHKDSLRFDK